MVNSENNLFLEIFSDEKEHSFEDYIKATALARKEYTEAKNLYESSLNEIILETNFDDVNETRKKLNLPKLSNSDQRKAYWKNQVQKYEYDMNCKYDYYLYCKTMLKVFEKGDKNE